jgi:hypothetical protein
VATQVPPNDKQVIGVGEGEAVGVGLGDAVGAAQNELQWKPVEHDAVISVPLQFHAFG